MESRPLVDPAQNRQAPAALSECTRRGSLHDHRRRRSGAAPRRTRPGDWRPMDVTTNGYRVRTYRPRIAGDLPASNASPIQAMANTGKSPTEQHRHVYGRSPAARIADPKIHAGSSGGCRNSVMTTGATGSPTSTRPKTPQHADDGDGGEPQERRSTLHQRLSEACPLRQSHALYPDANFPYDPSQPADPAFHFELVFDYGEHDLFIPQPQEVGGQTWPYRTDAFSSFRSDSKSALRVFAAGCSCSTTSRTKCWAATSWCGLWS